MYVGPTAGSDEWWRYSAIGGRECWRDDTYTFSEAKLTIDMQNETWLEDWQGEAVGCGTPVAPFESGTFSYNFVEASDKLEVLGTGAFICLPKAYNGGEYASLDNLQSKVTYDVVSLSSDSMELSINAGPYWTFRLSKDNPS